MILLKKVTIHKYKSYETEQCFDIEDDVTVLVGKNESGKTAALEAIAKTNYFENDDKFEFSVTHDYPRKEKKRYDKSGRNDPVVTCDYELSDELLAVISEDIGAGVFNVSEITITTLYENNRTIGGVEADLGQFLENKISLFDISGDAERENICEIENIEDVNNLISQEQTRLRNAQQKENELATKEERTPKNIKSGSYLECLKSIKPYFESKKWNDPLGEYVYNTHISPNLPKFLYYDEYYTLPSRIDIAHLKNQSLDREELKTSKALFELADINTDDVMNSDDFETFVAELEATGNEITRQLFEYWSTNKELRIHFRIDKKPIPGSNGFRHILDIRVENTKHMVTLPLKNRSKGFNWFFSFIVWFSKIQEDEGSNYILLLDEPGLNLHAAAQADLLDFIETLSGDYQVIYTTHSPFMVESGKLDRVRTIVEKDSGTTVTDSIQEKDPDTLFPLQAALGYNLAQNLFISKNNLLVEGPADLLYLNVMSNVLKESGRCGLDDKITVVPVGGLDKVVTFISLLRATKLNTVCLLDTFTNSKGRQKVDNLVQNKIIKKKNLLFFDEFTTGNKADIEDLFDRKDYIKILNPALEDKNDVKLGDLDKGSDRIIPQLNALFDTERFNHYQPANYLLRQAPAADFFEDDTLNRFEEVFIAVNKLF